MDIKQFDKFIAWYRAKGDKQAMEKRIEYTESRGDQDVHANFKATGADIELDPLKVLYTFMKKHWSSLVNYIKTGKTYSSEDILERIMDLIQYLELTAAYIQEQRKKSIAANEDAEVVVDEFEKPQVINKDTMKALAEKKGIQNDQEC